MTRKGNRIYQPIDEQENGLTRFTEDDEWNEVGDVDKQKRQAR
jgi:hypothetical protein